MGNLDDNNVGNGQDGKDTENGKEENKEFLAGNGECNLFGETDSDKNGGNNAVNNSENSSDKTGSDNSENTRSGEDNYFGNNPQQNVGNNGNQGGNVGYNGNNQSNGQNDNYFGNNPQQNVGNNGNQGGNGGYNGNNQGSNGGYNGNNQGYNGGNGGYNGNNQGYNGGNGGNNGNNFEGVYPELNQQHPSNIMGILSMIFGIISIACCCINYFPLVLSIAGLVLGIIQQRKYKNGIALAGIITSSIGLGLGIIVIILNSVIPTDEQYWKDYFKNYFGESDSSIISFLKNIFKK